MTAANTTTPAPTGLVVRPEDKGKFLDLDSARTNRRFLDAYSSGKLDSLGADEQAMFLFALGAKLGLRPELGELMIYQGKPYITIDGRFRIAHLSGLLTGVEPRPAMPHERRNYGVGATDALWVCDVSRRGASRPFRGWGHVGAKDRNPVGRTHPAELAKKRAKYDGLRMAFPPKEEVSEEHARFIEDAERMLQVARGSFTPLPLTSGDYETGAEEVPSDFDGDQAAADAEAATTDEARELPLGDARKRRGTDALRDG